MRVDVPLTFEDKGKYLNKLKELIDTEGQIDKYNIEQVAEKDISFKFIE